MELADRHRGADLGMPCTVLCVDAKEAVHELKTGSRELHHIALLQLAIFLPYKILLMLFRKYYD